MKTKTIFDINSKIISNGFQKAFDTLKNFKLKVFASTGKVYLNISLLVAIIIGIIFPVALILLFAFTIFSKLTISIEQEV
ncbi:hypothetical protein SF1_23860 [Sphingobacterium faecium NBRC 15299]|uniref:hypothetical protein n=1 Tax=Sphingobacterium faecium TaxID=34087 RepID=UPI000D384852|nr:hypothetical protein [Sphingobacterium faecium]PTX10291.1 hypothetical protein C8N37_105299 [Sphingobacterium faecium]GEM64404.1 hypothetical protein SF1_23860 [Sphingobacterium faecium NBRC 15299]